MSQEKIQWEKPELIILDRIRKDESVLLKCMWTGQGCTVNEAGRDGSQTS